MKYRLLFAATALLATTWQTLAIEVSPGEIAQGKAGIDLIASTLTLTGAVDASDLHFIAGNMPELRTLDLSGVTIAAYNGNLGTSVCSYPAAELPAYVLSGLRAETVLLPTGITSIGAGALMGAHITAVTVPSGVSSIGAAAFEGCASLATVTLPATVTEIPQYCFKECVSLTTAGLPMSLKTIGMGAFEDCTALAALNFGSLGALQSIGADAFRGSGLETADMTECGSLLKVGAFAFADMPALTEIAFPDKCMLDGDGVLFGDEALTVVMLPATMTAMPPLSLYGDTSVSGVTLPDGMEDIGELAMGNLTSVKGITLPPALSSIATAAFENWDDLEEIDATALETVPALGEDVWGDIDKGNVTLRVADEAGALFATAPQWKDFKVLFQSDDPQTVLEFIDKSLGKIDVKVTGKVLKVVSEGSPLEALRIYDITGTPLVTRSNICSRSASINMREHDATVIIIVAALSDGTVATAKHTL